MKKKISLTLVLLGSVALSGIVSLLRGAVQSGATVQERVGEGGFSPNLPRSLIYRQNDGTVLSTSGEPNNFQLSIARPGLQPFVIALPDDIVQLDSVTGIPGNEVVVIGMVNSSVAEVVIVGTLNYRIADKFLAYDPAVSPNGKLIAFIKFYPPHFVQGTTDYVMVYDLTRSADGNRPVSAAVDNDTNVGTAVYPPGIQAADRNTEVPETSVSHVTSKTFFWAPDSSKLLFSAERLLEENQNTHEDRNAKSARVELNLVLVKIRASDGTPAVTVFPVIECTARGASCEQQLGSVEFDQAGIKAQFQGLGSKAGRRQLLSVEYGEFHSP